MVMNHKKADQDNVKKRSKSNSQFAAIIKRLRRNKSAMIGLYIILLLVIIAIFAPWLSPYKYDQTDLKNAFAAPS